MARTTLAALLALGPLLLTGWLAGCSAEATPPDVDHEDEPTPLGELSSALVSYDCATHKDTGYSNGQPFEITVVTVDGKPVEVETANAFLTMAKAAEAAGVALHINSGFRTMAEQQYLYGCYKNCNCNSCNLAAAPGYSNHQSGHALDLNTASGGVYSWLDAHGAQFGFKRTVPSEPWHWEWWGGGSPQNFCSVAVCDASAGGFTFSCDGPQAGMECVNVHEPADPHSWADNHFCGPADAQLQWSFAGPLAGLECVNVHESSEPLAQAWSDNFLCVPPQSPYQLAYSSAGPIAGKTCIPWGEPADLANSWGDNFVCVTHRSVFTSGRFSFSGAGPLADRTCLSVDEPSDPDTWGDNFLCTQGDFGLQWSSAGPLAGLTCTAVTEGSEPAAATWDDNFLCAPPQTPWTFTWSSAGADPSTCVRWYEGADLAHT